MAANDWHVYIVECADRSLYTGVARDVAARLAMHNSGAGAKYTRGRLPVALVWSEPAASHGAALRREHELKKLPAAEKRRLAARARGRKGHPIGRQNKVI